MILNNREVSRNMPDFAFEVAPNDASTCKSLIKKFETEGLELNLDVAGTTARCVRPSKRSRLGYVNVFHYYFRSTERMFEFCDKHLVDLEAKKEHKARRAVEKKERITMARNSVIVDDIFVSSWGYEQTNVDAFQVVEKIGNASVVLRPIACRAVKGTEISHGMAQNVVPVHNAFIGEETFTKRITEYGIKINSYSSAFQWDGKREFYNSWYA
jgi:hypothetical protein